MPWAGTVSADHSAGYSVATDTYAAPVPALASRMLVLASITTNTSSNDSVTPPSGWTTLLDDGAGGLRLTGSVGFWWGWHEVTDAELVSPPASWDFVLGASLTGNVDVQAVTGHRVGNPFATAIAYTVGSISDTVPLTVAGLTVPADNSLMVGGCTLQSGSTRSLTVPTSWTQDDTTCLLGYGRGQTVAHLAVDAGATGDQDWYQSDTSLAAAGWQVIIAPAATIPVLPVRANQVWRTHG